MSEHTLVWGEPGPCPFCGVVTEATTFDWIIGRTRDPATQQFVQKQLGGSEGEPLISQCVSKTCRNLVIWLRSGIEEPRLVYPQRGVRIPPEDGLSPEEEDLYREAAGVEPLSRRAASALLRVLLEAFLKRHLLEKGHSTKDKSLVQIIDLAVDHLDLSTTLKTGLTAIRKRGNTDVHDPYGLTDKERVEDLPWLFEAVDHLIDDLHVKPKRWAKIVNPST